MNFQNLVNKMKSIELDDPLPLEKKLKKKNFKNFFISSKNLIFRTFLFLFQKQKIYHYNKFIKTRTSPAKIKKPKFIYIRT